MSLNRTMQYGNIFVISSLAEGASGFKSYYVVWKPSKFEYISMR